MNFITVKVREKPSVEGLRWKKFWELDTEITKNATWAGRKMKIDREVNNIQNRIRNCDINPIIAWEEHSREIQER